MILFAKLDKSGLLERGSGDTIPEGYLPLDSFPKGDNGEYFEYYNEDLTPNVIKNQEKLAIQAEKDRKNLGEDYTKENGELYKVSFQKDDADGVMQVKSAFEMGLSDTVIHFENGTKMPITAGEFAHFALWFVEKRNSFFIGGN